MIVPFKIDVEFGTLTVFPIGLVAPCLEWSEAEISQGFVLGGNQVEFLTLQYNGTVEMAIQIEDEVELRPDTIRAIQVPIFIDEDSDVAVYPVTSIWFGIPEGEYCLVYQTGLKPFVFEGQAKQGDFTPAWDDMWCVFTFVRQDNVEAKILRQDGLLNPPSPLVTTPDYSKPLISPTPSMWPSTS